MNNTECAGIRFNAVEEMYTSVLAAPREERLKMPFISWRTIKEQLRVVTELTSLKWLAIVLHWLICTIRKTEKQKIGL